MAAVLTNFFAFLNKGAILIGLSAIVFGSLGMPSMKAPLQTANCTIETNVNPWIFTFLVYIQGSWTLGKTIWDKTQVLLQTSGGPQLGTLWEHGNPLGAWWEHIGNKGKKQKKSLSPAPEKKKPGSFTSACWASSLAAWNFSFQNCWSPFFT